MSRIWSAIVGVALLIGCRSSDQAAALGEAPSVEGSWEVTSVQRDGELDPVQVGARMTFTGDEVKFAPKAVQIDDGTS